MLIGVLWKYVCAVLNIGRKIPTFLKLVAKLVLVLVFDLKFAPNHNFETDWPLL